MSQWGDFALPLPGTPHQWQAEGFPAQSPLRRGVSAWRVTVSCLGLLLTTAAVAAVCILARPATMVETRIMADSTGPASRATLADAALRLASLPGQSAALDAYGETLTVAVTDADPAVAWQRARSTADAVLNMSVAAQPRRPASTAGAAPVRPDPDGGRRAALLADRSRLQAELDSADGRLSSVSASMTGIARDIAAGARSAAERKPGHETLDKATVALADLQLQRIQLQSRYQDDYPLVVALDGQIRSLRSFMQDEQHRLDTTARGAPDGVDPALSSERDRLRAELAQLTDRRAAAVSELAGVTRTLALPTPNRPSPRMDTTVADLPSPSPVLIEGATTVTSGPDIRWVVAPAIAAVGLLLSLLAWFMPGRRYRPAPTELLLQRLEALLLPSAGAPPGSYTALGRDTPVTMSRLHAALELQGQRP